MIIRFAALTIAATWIFWQIAFSSLNAVRLPEITGFAPFGATTASSEEAPSSVFYRRVTPGQYEVYGTAAAGQIVRSLRLPGETVTKADGSTAALSGKQGYLTAPDNGAFFIWYPQIGQQVYVFNERGSFLWEKEESHYLHALPRGRYILAAAGDHSRMIFMNPDFKTQADFQGTLFTRFNADDNPELTAAQVCLGSLDGELIIAHLDRKVFFRQKIGYALKSLVCDFAAGELAVIVERTVEVEKKNVQKDFLLRMKFSLKSPKTDVPADSMRMVEPDLDTLLTAELPIRTVTASPLVLTRDGVCFLQALAQTDGSSDGSGFYFTRGKKSSLQHIPLPAVNSTSGTVAGDSSPDLWKSQAIDLQGESACLFAHASGRLLVANRRGILLDRSDMPVERLVGKNDAAYLQVANGVFTLK